jgi:hypothetical protein
VAGIRLRYTHSLALISKRADTTAAADTVQNIIWRLTNGELENVNPKIIVNNVGNVAPRDNEDPRVADITRGLKAILDICQQKAPNATIVLMGITEDVVV